MTTSNRPRIAVIGAGFAGLQIAARLRKAPVDLTLVDQHPHHTFQPLLYQVATAQLEAGDVARQVRAVLRGHAGARFRYATVTGVDWDTNELQLQAEAGPDRLAFDQLVVAPGAIYADFGVPGVREHTHFLKSLSEAVNLRSTILRRFEYAAADPDATEEGDLTFAIVGGGPTGVELSGALAELVHVLLPGEYPELAGKKPRIVLVEMTDGVLSGFQPGSRRHAERTLTQRGVEVRLGSAVQEVRSDRLILAGGEELPARTIVWAAGVQAHPLAAALGVETGPGGRIVVEPDLSLPGKPHAFAAGDVAASRDEQGDLHPQVAPVAIQHGATVARNLLARIEGRPTRPFRYLDKGSMAIVGRNSGVAELSPRLGGLALRGFLGWLAWLFLHLLYLPGHRNRAGALLSWGYEYFTHDKHARLILEAVPSPAERTGRSGRVQDAQRDG